MTIDRTITEAMTAAFRAQVKGNPKHETAMNAIIAAGIRKTALDYRVPLRLPFVFSTDIAAGKPTDQKLTGRCWMFAGLNLLRAAIAGKWNLDQFELSQNYLMFWDKLEKSNYFLENILSTLDEATDSRLVTWLLTDPLPDAGQWDMFVSLVEKYGSVPKQVMPETYHSSNSQAMNGLLASKLRENAAALRKLCRQGESAQHIAVRKEAMLSDIYRILCRFLGEPPQTFDFEFRDKDKRFHRELRLDPRTFVRKYAGVDLQRYVSIIHAPTQDKPYGKTYTVRCLGNVRGGRPVTYLNLDIADFKSLAVAQLEAGEPVWFGCDAGKMSDKDTGVLDANLFDYAGALDTPFAMSKEDRLDYRDSCLTHAMVFVGINRAEGQPIRWKVENSWGCEAGQDGYYVMSDSWFEEYMYQIVVNRQYLSADQRSALEHGPVELEPWDPMGALAVVRSSA